jgi:hypothetical protein
VPPWRDAGGLVLGLVVLSALPLTLSRLLDFELSNSSTADEFSESTVPWVLMIVLPLVVGAGLLAAGSRFPRGLPVAYGLVLGAGLVLIEHAGFWVLYFAADDTYPPGPAVWWLVLGAVVVAAAGVVLLRTALAGRPTVRRDWRVACAVVVVGCTLVFLAAGLGSATSAGWLAAYLGTLLLGAAGLAVSLLWLRSDQRTAALVALTLFGFWSAYFPIQELIAPQLYLETSIWVAEIVGVVLTLLACYLAQAGPARVPSDQ